jgi:hypothetical protein
MGNNLSQQQYIMKSPSDSKVMKPAIKGDLRVIEPATKGEYGKIYDLYETSEIHTMMKNVKKQYDDDNLYTVPHPDEVYQISSLISSRKCTSLMKLILNLDKYPLLIYDIEQYMYDPYHTTEYELNKQNEKGWTALMIVCRCANSPYAIQIAKLLLNHKVDINIKENDGWTCAMIVARYANSLNGLEMLKLLISSGADLSLKNNNGWDALTFAACYSKEESSLNAVKLILKAIKNNNISLKSSSLRLEMTSKSLSLRLDMKIDKNVMENILYNLPTTDLRVIPMLISYGALLPTSLELQNKIIILQNNLNYDKKSYKRNTFLKA